MTSYLPRFDDMQNVDKVRNTSEGMQSIRTQLTSVSVQWCETLELKPKKETLMLFGK